MAQNGLAECKIALAAVSNRHLAMHEKHVLR